MNFIFRGGQIAGVEGVLNKAQDIAKKKAAKSAENLAKQLAAAKRAKQAEERTHAIKQSVMGFKDKDDIIDRM